MKRAYCPGSGGLAGKHQKAQAINEDELPMDRRHEIGLETSRRHAEMAPIRSGASDY